MKKLYSEELKILLFLLLLFCLSCPSYAYARPAPATSWVENSPASLSCDFVDSASGDSDGVVFVGNEGKVYYMDSTSAKSLSPSLSTKCYLTTQKDFTAVAYGNGKFMALTEDEWFTGTVSGSAISWSKGGTNAALSSSGPFTGVVHVAGDVFMAVTPKGGLFRLEGSNIHEVVGVLLPEMGSSSLVKGITRLNDSVFIIYGYADSVGVNAFRVKFLGTTLTAAIDPAVNMFTDSQYKIKQSGQPVEINDLVIVDAAKWYVAGQNGVFGYCTGDLSLSGVEFDLTTGSVLSTPITNNFNAVGIMIHSGSQKGYGVTEGGRIFYTSLDSLSVRTTREYYPGLSSEDYKTVCMFTIADSQNYVRAYLSGNNGQCFCSRFGGSIEHRGSFVSSSDSSIFQSDINSVCTVSESRVVVGGKDGLLARGDKDSDGVFNWTKCGFQELGTMTVHEIHSCGNFIYVVYATGTNKFKVATLDLDGNFQSVSSEFNAEFKNSLAVKPDGPNKVYVGTDSGMYTFIPDIVYSYKNSNPNINYAALAAKDAFALYMAEVTGGDSVLYKSTNPGVGGWVSAEIKSFSGKTIACLLMIGDDLYIGGKDTVAGKAFLAKYDGTAFTEFSVGPDNVELLKLWSYGNYIYALGDSSNGYVYNYNLETNVWTSEYVNVIELYGLSGSGIGGFIMAGGESGRVFRTKIESGSGGGEETSTEVLPATGEDADLIASNNPVKRTSVELHKQFNTAPDFEPVGNVEDFTTKTTLAAASVHCFKFNVTPDTDIFINDCHLYKLISATSSSTDYVRINIIPNIADHEHGTFWVTDTNGNLKVSGEQLRASITYTIYFVIEDNGRVFDADPTLGCIADPTIFGSTGSGSGGGCVLNSQADGSIELVGLVILGVLGMCLRIRRKQ
ncbi:hypothetical protein SAMN05660337_1299 [Maridesulfovibrio ferrireducens]|uniref:Uncharacterized protein n=1 Tax=Maridesulfovibrio ferrireducens TaxID=246191 RepID=A0A1G9EX50_9BACT|nr:hypothetical protein [Maridesulfovibrio ferrireducens]SDK80679.1 hypothetical protein SAMN05660337_1299 [Maridesulfovibrio ferrireducens]